MKKKYGIGYAPGVYDLFHIGHLNLLKASSELCEYLIAGVLTDELVEHFKGTNPLIPFEERIAIVEAIRYVDKVIPIDFHNTKKIDAWKELHFDCHFSGSDHGPEWENDLKQLQSVGSNMEFLTYTKGVSSSSRKLALLGKGTSSKTFIFGAGACGQKLLKALKENKNNKNFHNIAGFLDNNAKKWNWEIDGVKVYGIHDLPYIAPDGLFTVIIAVVYEEEVRKQLLDYGISNLISYQDIYREIEFMEKL